MTGRYNISMVLDLLTQGDVFKGKDRLVYSKPVSEITSPDHTAVTWYQSLVTAKSSELWTEYNILDGSLQNAFYEDVVMETLHWIVMAVPDDALSAVDVIGKPDLGIMRISIGDAYVWSSIIVVQAGDNDVFKVRSAEDMASSLFVCLVGEKANS